jgi:hypothetical protein
MQLAAQHGYHDRQSTDEHDHESEQYVLKQRRLDPSRHQVARETERYTHEQLANEVQPEKHERHAQRGIDGSEVRERSLSVHGAFPSFRLLCARGLRFGQIFIRIDVLREPTACAPVRLPCPPRLRPT